jgi:hypothetical protein
MSAWIPNREHIDLLASAIDLMRGKIEDHVPLNLDDIGQTLVDEVVESVSFRYPNDNVEAGELPGPLDAYYLKPYRHQPQGFTPDAAEMRQLVSCYAYQACEHPGWETSTAQTWCQSLTDALGKGNETGPWGWDDRSVALRLEQGAPFTSDVYVKG